MTVTSRNESLPGERYAAQDRGLRAGPEAGIQADQNIRSSAKQASSSSLGSVVAVVEKTPQRVGSMTPTVQPPPPPLPLITKARFFHLVGTANTL
ncbi:hypothetical protein ElyMa_002896400 [Elysia marginata]|uniref:Uncharacterized protein n=1 Tax=Elysia marginata TaxID=1093978 RepID=A0AAV4I2I4_9GAST|nr:hypothetical protein ElyMa_002896400 [Elysia marginata]